MRRARRSAVLAALATLAAAGIAPLAPTPSPTQAVQQSSQAGDKQLPTPTQQQVQQALRFLADAGAPLRVGHHHGCPWPGRRAACARRSAGAVARMR